MDPKASENPADRGPEKLKITSRANNSVILHYLLVSTKVQVECQKGQGQGHSDTGKTGHRQERRWGHRYDSQPRGQVKYDHQVGTLSPQLVKAVSSYAGRAGSMNEMVLFYTTQLTLERSEGAKRRHRLLKSVAHERSECDKHSAKKDYFSHR
ncbi:hypothetical protein TSAR_015238 [Trichomalopsis sarcophagae]|uniref:Uncharacterized protein n=1 Tax=Trichomalopsis sarcophagae TaxID=543379 RepID=A0A232F5F6_9HYME|nr:hypothetical protein TSAR_015238 [Trichomalopsis sarcophagae]